MPSFSHRATSAAFIEGGGGEGGGGEGGGGDGVVWLATALLRLWGAVTSPGIGAAEIPSVVLSFWLLDIAARL